MSQVARFGIFEADLATGELRKQGRLVHLQPQPFALLRALLEEPGSSVSREDLRRRLWPASVNVDFDQSLNKSITKLRTALGDSASSPRFIETLPRRGYRFIAQVSVSEVMAAPAAITPSQPLDPPLLPEPASAGGSVVTILSLVPLGAMVALAILLSYSMPPPRSRLGSTTIAAAPASLADSPARDEYGRGRIALSRRTEEGLRSAVGLFERALARDPLYAAAYVGLADAWSLLASYGVENSSQALERAREFASHALTLDPGSAEAHTSLGRTAMLADWDWRSAEQHFQRAIATQPRYPTAHHWYAYLLSATGRHSDAEREARMAASLDPESLIAATGVGYVLYAARRFDEAAAALVKVIEMDPDFMQARKNLGLVLMAQGRRAEAILQFERVVRSSGESTVSQADLAWARGRAGDVTGARRLLMQLQAKDAKRHVPLDSLSLALLGAGRTEQAVAALDAAFTVKVAGLSRLAVDPRWDELRGSPPVRAMAASISAGVAR